MKSQPPGTNTDTGCGNCALCCKLLTIDADPEVSQMTEGQADFPAKPWNTWCKHCKPGSSPGGCGIYPVRPKACITYQCLYLQSLLRVDVPSLPLALKPNVCHVVMMGSLEDNMVLFAHVDPAYPSAWREEPVRSHLIRTSNLGLTIIVVVSGDRFVMTRGRPTVKMSEGQAIQLAEGKFIRQRPDGNFEIGINGAY